MNRAKVFRRVAEQQEKDRKTSVVYAIDYTLFVANSNTKIFCIALNNVFGYGKTRLARLQEQTSPKYERYITENIMSWDCERIRNDEKHTLDHTRKVMTDSAGLCFDTLREVYGFGDKRLKRLAVAANEVYREYMLTGVHDDWEYADAILDRRMKQIMGEE